MEIALRRETEQDHRAVEELTREAFWNVYVPGCNEHLLVHNLRKTKEFIAELDLVAIYDDKIVGNIVYCETKVKDGDKEWEVLTFGPISILPEYQNNGIGAKLIRHTIKLSKETGYRAIIIYGDPEYYKRFGFAESKNYDITDKSRRFPAALLVFELHQNALTGIKGMFDEGANYEINDNELDEFEKGFDKKEKTVTKSQEKFQEMSNKYL